LPNQNFRVKNGLEVGTGATISSGGNITAGIISATSFVGSGSQLTGIVASGTVNYANISGVSSSVVGGAVSATSLRVTGVSTFDGAINVRNGYNLNIGDNNDLRIYNDGTDSRIEETGSGSLYISGSNINIQQHSTNKNLAKFIGGVVELYYDDSKKFSTSGIGVTITGTLVADQINVSGVATFQNSVYLGDNDFIYFGDSSDLYIGHNGSVSAIADAGTGDLYIAGDNSLIISDLSYAENKAKFNTNGSVELYYDNSKKFETLGTGVTVTGTTFTDQLNVSGVVTASSFSGNASSATYSTTSGISSYSTSSGIATYSTTAEVSTSVIGGIGSITQLQVTGNASVSENLGIGTTNPPDKLTVSGKIQIQQDSGSNNRIVFRGQPASSYRWNIDNYSSSNEFRIYREDDATSANGFVAVSITTNGQVSIASTVRDSNGNVRTVPANAQTSAYILAASDVGKHISITTGGITVNSGIFSAGDAVSIYNNSSSNQTITQGTSVTMYLVGTATTGNRTLAQRGVATVLCVGTNTFVIMGGGLT
jgi:hypothetical protein